MITANGVIRETELTPNTLTIMCETTIGNQIGKAPFQLENNTENLYKILALTTSHCWERVSGSPIRVHIFEENGNYRLGGIGHFLNDEWYDMPWAVEKKEENK